jgi:tetratricopeptide (TPR) repeat protein
MGRLSEAEGEHRKAVEIYGKLAADNPAVTEFRTSLATSHTNLSVILHRLARLAEACDGYDKAIAIREALVKEIPKVSTYRIDLARSYRFRGLARRDQGDPAGAAADLRQALAVWEGLPSRTGEEWFEAACARATLAFLAGLDGSAAEVAREAETAMTLLHKAVAMGYRNLVAFRTMPGLNPLRGRDDFKLLMMDLSMPDDPFAAAH